MGWRGYTDEEREWLAQNYPSLGETETAKKFNEIFNQSKSKDAIQKYCIRNLGLKVSEERLKKRYAGFTSELGSVSKNCRGEYKIKTENGWIPLTHFKFDVPKGYIAYHLNGNKDDFSEENIVVIRNGVQTIMRNEGMQSENKEIALASVKWCELYQILRKQGVSHRTLNMYREY